MKRAGTQRVPALFNNYFIRDIPFCKMQEAVNELKEAASGEEDGDIPGFRNGTAKSLPDRRLHF